MCVSSLIHCVLYFYGYKEKILSNLFKPTAKIKAAEIMHVNNFAVIKSSFRGPLKLSYVEFIKLLRHTLMRVFFTM